MNQGYNNQRPLSPHLTIYRKQISSVLSALHRITGIGVFFAGSLITWVTILYIYTGFNNLFLSYFYNTCFKALIYATLFGICFHLCTGIRHLVWDMGYCFSIKDISITGWAAVISAVILFVLIIIL